jgi:hypothetical protein
MKKYTYTLRLTDQEFFLVLAAVRGWVVNEEESKIDWKRKLCGRLERYDKKNFK